MACVQKHNALYGKAIVYCEALNPETTKKFEINEWFKMITRGRLSTFTKAFQPKIVVFAEQRQTDFNTKQR